MENTADWAQMQQNPPVNAVNHAAQAELYANQGYQNPHYAAAATYYPQNPNPIPNPANPLQSYTVNTQDSDIHPPGVDVDPYANVHLNSYQDTVNSVSSGSEIQQLAAAYAYLQTVAAGSTAAHAYYQNQNVIEQLASNPYGTVSVSFPVLFIWVFIFCDAIPWIVDMNCFLVIFGERLDLI